MKILLGGGGDAEDERPLHEILARWLGQSGRLLYWPVALRGMVTFDSCFEWINSALQPFGITDIAMWTNLRDHKEDELEAFEGIFIGGGNTFSLLEEVRESGFEIPLGAFARRGKPVYGGSAGAVLLGRDIQIVESVDSNDVGIQDTRGLDLAGGYAVWPHYEPKHDTLIRSYMEQYKFPVLAIPERSGIVVEGGDLRRAGVEPAYRFDERGRSEI